MLNYRYKEREVLESNQCGLSAGYGLANRRITSLPTSQINAMRSEACPLQTGHMTHQVEYSSF